MVARIRLRIPTINLRAAVVVVVVAAVVLILKYGYVSNIRIDLPTMLMTHFTKIPAVIIVLFILAVFVLMWSRKGLGARLRQTFSGNSTTNRTANTSNTARTTTAAGGTSTTGNAAAPRRTTGRRTRRTPSQISTTSLPVYMKEPGDQELVIIR